jgi:hypothetical protein
MPERRVSSVMTEVVTCANPQGCMLCGAVEAGHGERFGLAHFGAGRPAGFVAPSDDLVARRLASRRCGDYEIAGLDASTGAHATYLVRTACRCGSTTLATVEHAPDAKCENCLRAAIGGAA